MKNGANLQLPALSVLQEGSMHAPGGRGVPGPALPHNLQDLGWHHEEVVGVGQEEVQF